VNIERYSVDAEGVVGSVQSACAALAGVSLVRAMFMPRSAISIIPVRQGVARSGAGGGDGEPHCSEGQRDLEARRFDNGGGVVEAGGRGADVEPGVGEE